MWASATRTPVHRSKKGDNHADIEELERRGYYQEQYRQLDREFGDWNYGIWQERWLVTKDAPCQLCGSQSPGITVQSVTVCIECLNEFPRVPWHPTGAVRPKVQTLFAHANNCAKHFSSSKSGEEH